LKIGLVLLFAFLFVGCAEPEPNEIQKASELLLAGNLPEALAYFEKSVALEEELDLAWRGIGFVKFQMNDFEGAALAFTTALEQGAEESPVIYNILGTHAMRELNFEGAIYYFEQGIALIEAVGVDGDAEAEWDYQELQQSLKHSRIVAYERMFRWERARELIEEYIMLYPDDAEAKREAEFLRTR